MTLQSLLLRVLALPGPGRALAESEWRTSVVDENLAVYGLDNLFASDASVFPSSVTVNPISTIMAMADYAAPRIMARA